MSVCCLTDAIDFKYKAVSILISLSSSELLPHDIFSGSTCVGIFTGWKVLADEMHSSLEQCSLAHALGSIGSGGLISVHLNLHLAPLTVRSCNFSSPTDL